MKSKALPHILLAVVLALAAGVLTIRWLGSQRSALEGKRAAQVKKIKVIVAARAIPKGTHLDAQMVREQPYDASLVPTNAERIIDDVVGRITVRDISQDDPITSDKLLPRGVSAAGLANIVESGKRAVTVKGSKVLGSGGLITPGSRVDVVATFTVPGEKSVQMSRVILQDIPVLTTGTELETHIGKDGREELANTDLFTLMVTPHQAERLALAADHGILHFALRRSGDNRPVVTPGMELDAMSRSGLLAAPGVGAAPAANGGPYAYQAVRSSAPNASVGGASGGGGGGGGQSAPDAKDAAKSKEGENGAAPAKPSSSSGAKELFQGSDHIKIYDVTIECPTCPQ